ncbi:MAG: glycosyltransferase family 39 protein [Krumholzibacteria bacterium]|nr:glycosyltransferase family 39 protein [Candidatus Krumholzibacteria bacterium]
MPSPCHTTNPGTTQPFGAALAGPAAAPAVWAMAAAALLIFLLPGMLGAYGMFIDEYYYASCAARPDWGYVDHPPGAPLALNVSLALLGEGLLALRLPAALLGASLVLGVGLLSRRLGADHWGQAVACLAIVAAPIYQIIFGVFAMNAFEVVLWFAVGWTVIEVERRRAPRLWLLVGLLVGTALMFKHTSVLLVAALAIGLVVTPGRRHLRGRYLWLGALLSLVLLGPNLIWQASHGWPSLEFYRNADLSKNIETPVHIGFLLQVLVTGPGALPLWVLGLVFFLRRRGDLDLRHLAWLSIVLLVLMLASQKSRPDRIAGMYPVLFAAGGALLTRLTSSRARRLRPAIVAWLVVSALPLVPLGLPILPPALLARYAASTGFVPQIEAGPGKAASLPQWFADRLGWERLVDVVEGARDRLPPTERGEVVYFVPSYGHAGALEWHGKERGLVPVYCTQNTWYLWGPPPRPVTVAIVVGNTAGSLATMFEHVEQAGYYEHDHIMPWRNRTAVWIVRGPREPIARMWPQWKHYE